YIGSKMFDMMRMKLNIFSGPGTCSAFLASIMIAFKHCLTPFFVFFSVSCGPILWRFSDIALPLNFIPLPRCFYSDAMGNRLRQTTSRTILSFFTANFVFAHCLIAIRARDFYIQTIIAYLTVRMMGFISKLLITDFANLTALLRRLYFRSTGRTQTCFRGVAIAINRWLWFSAKRTRQGAIANTIFANMASASIATYPAIHHIGHMTIPNKMPPLARGAIVQVASDEPLGANVIINAKAPCGLCYLNISILAQVGFNG
ncbi:MAG: hypothetical protein AAB649_05450, partial [Patescibacteria group bacterium]